MPASPTSPKPQPAKAGDSGAIRMARKVITDSTRPSISLGTTCISSPPTAALTAGADTITTPRTGSTTRRSGQIVTTTIAAANAPMHATTRTPVGMRLTACPASTAPRSAPAPSANVTIPITSGLWPAICIE